MSNLLNDLWMKVRIAAGTCAANNDIEQVKDFLAKGEEYTRYAASAGMLVGIRPGAYANLGKAAEAIGQVRKTVSMVQSVCMDVRAIAQIRAAIVVLNDPANMKPGSEAAAIAFGQLFVGAGRFAAKLPPPANAYAQILESCGDFFVGMQRKLDPEKRWKRQFEQIEGWK